jgi:eukaryotic-like serine/threonine-protein kinase
MRLRHERIVGTHNVFTEACRYYIVMEYLAGDALEARLQARGALPPDEAVRIAVEVCQGLGVPDGLERCR